MRALLVVAVAAALSGCRTTGYTAIVLPREEFTSQDSCFRDCPQGGLQESYLNCVRSCPDAQIIEDQECAELPLTSGLRCTEQTHSKFSPGKTIVLVVVLAAVGAVVLGATAVAAYGNGYCSTPGGCP